jgi:choline dehydrogenase-like flavoprotein
MAEFDYLVVGGGTAGCIVASVFPAIPSVNPVVTVMLTAERAADLIRQDLPYRG